LLLDANDPTVLKARLDTLFMRPELPFEKPCQYRDGTIFTERLVPFKNKCSLYYGKAGFYVGAATAPRDI
jgi:predicted GH43/DUF377 family glycosyl hydrolase